MKDFKGKKGKWSQLILEVGGQILYHLPVRAGLLTPCDLFLDAICSHYLLTRLLKGKLEKWSAAAKSLQSCPTLCDPIDGRPPAPPSSRFSRQEHWSGLPFPPPMHESEKWKVKVKLLSRVQLLATPWSAAYQAPQSMGFSRQEYWSGLPLPSHPLITYVLFLLL